WFKSPLSSLAMTSTKYPDGDFSDILVCASEFIPERLYFVTLKSDVRPKSTPNTHYFNIDKDLVYENFYFDSFDTVLSSIGSYPARGSLEEDLHYTSKEAQKRANAAYLIGSYAVIYLNMTPQEAYRPLYMPFRDASYGPAFYTISIMDCLNAFSDFDYEEYEHYEKVQCGDFNWLVPTKIEVGYHLHAPEAYFDYFRLHKVSTIVRLNKRSTMRRDLWMGAFAMRISFFIDGSTPSDEILHRFINICETTSGGIAVHCKADHCLASDLSPGIHHGHQQTWLEEKQSEMWNKGRVSEGPWDQVDAQGQLKKILLKERHKGTSATKKDNFAKIVNKVENIKIRGDDNGNDINDIMEDEENRLVGSPDLNEDIVNGNG
ncbi:Uncharacterized protein FKW44_011632, partial [Caligus rogercresseyi]